MVLNGDSHIFFTSIQIIQKLDSLTLIVFLNITNKTIKEDTPGQTFPQNNHSLNGIHFK